MNEVYKTIWNFPDYEVSNLGNFRRKAGKRAVRRVSEKQILPHKGETCLYVKLFCDGKGHRCSVALIIAEAFLSNPRGCTRIIYKDRNPYNAELSNLKWVNNTELGLYCFQGKNRHYSEADTRENQIKNIERNIMIAQSFLDSVRVNDIAGINKILLFFENEIHSCIARWTRSQSRHDECYQYVACAFLDKVNRNLMVSANIEAYLRGIIRKYFLKERAKKRTRKEVCYNDHLIYSKF